MNRGKTPYASGVDFDHFFNGSSGRKSGAIIARNAWNMKNGVGVA
jgi:hypothetical protein